MNYYNTYIAAELMNPSDNKVSLEIPLNTDMKIFAFIFSDEYTPDQLLSGVSGVSYYGESPSFSIETSTNNLSLGVTLQSTGTSDGEDDAEDSTGTVDYEDEAADDTSALDTTAPTVSLTPDTLTSSDFAVVQSTETGTAYLINTDVTVTNTTSIIGAADNMSNSVVISTANTDTNLTVTGLVEGTYKAYALDGAGNLSDPSADSVSIDGQLVDIDGNVYSTVVIGTQHWMAENLKVTKYREGDNLTQATNTSTWSDTDGAYRSYDDNAENIDIYGMLYNGYAADNSSGQNICPQGWHVPSVTEFNTLKSFLVQSGDTNFITKLREGGTDHWTGDPYDASNSTGFTALGSGYVTTSGTSNQLNIYAYWWTCCYSNNPYYVGIAYTGTSSYVSYQITRNYGFAVRCLED